MRIVHVIARLNDGGPARVVAALAQSMSQRGHDVLVLAGATAADEPDLSDQLAARGVRVERLRGLARQLAPLSDAGAFMGLAARLRELSPDVVHTHTAKAGALGRVASRWLGLPCLHTYHGHVLSGYFSTGLSAAARVVERLIASNHHHQALTPSQLIELRDHFAIGRSPRWHWLPPPVAPVGRTAAAWHARLAPGMPVVGFLGRLAPVKDAGLFLDCLAAVAARMPVQGLVCGDGGERTALEARSRTFPVPLLFTGFVPAGEALAAMDVLVISSRNEGLPLTVVEAASAGVPVVAPPVGGCLDLARWGMVEPARRDARSLAQEVLAMLTDRDRRRSRLAAAAAVARRLTPEVLASSYDALYREVCQTPC